MLFYIDMQTSNAMQFSVLYFSTNTTIVSVQSPYNIELNLQLSNLRTPKGIIHIQLLCVPL
jgi:hypothetical protein